MTSLPKFVSRFLAAAFLIGIIAQSTSSPYGVFHGLSQNPARSQYGTSVIGAPLIYASKQFSSVAQPIPPHNHQQRPSVSQFPVQSSDHQQRPAHCIVRSGYTFQQGICLSQQRCRAAEGYQAFKHRSCRSGRLWMACCLKGAAGMACGGWIHVVALQWQPNQLKMDCDRCALHCRKPKSIARPICLPWDEERTAKIPGRNVVLTGWGATQSGGELSPVLQVVVLEAFNSSKCDDGYKTLPGYRRDFPNGIRDGDFVCAGDKEGGKDACGGDSGGPISYNSMDHGFVLAGVVSKGYGCGLPQFPGLYTPLHREDYLSWIKATAFS